MHWLRTSIFDELVAEEFSNFGDDGHFQLSGDATHHGKSAADPSTVPYSLPMMTSSHLLEAPNTISCVGVLHWSIVCVAKGWPGLYND
jgi:hypothetical protein